MYFKIPHFFNYILLFFLIISFLLILFLFLLVFIIIFSFFYIYILLSVLFFSPFLFCPIHRLLSKPRVFWSNIFHLNPIWSSINTFNDWHWFFGRDYSPKISDSRTKKRKTLNSQKAFNSQNQKHKKIRKPQEHSWTWIFFLATSLHRTSQPTHKIIT